MIPDPANPSRLRALRATGLLDAAASPALDRLTRLASHLLDAPIALVSLVDAHRQFFASALGLPEPWASRREMPLTHSFCLYATRSVSPLVVPDAREHPVLRDNLAVRDLDAIAYAGIPLVVRGEIIGSFCVIDDRPRAWSEEQVRLLDDLAASVLAEILLRIEVRAGAEQRALTAALLESLGDGVLAIDLENTFLVANSAARRWFEGAEAGTTLPADWAVSHRATRRDGSSLPPREGALGRALHGEPTDGLTFALQGPSAPEPAWVEASGRPVRDQDGRLIAAIAVYRDIGDRMRQAEENAALTARLAVQGREQSLATILDSIGDALIVADAERRVERMNPEAESLTGWAASEATGRPLSEVMRVRDVGGNTLVLSARDGHERFVACSESQVAARGTDPTGLVVVFREVSQERAAQQQLHASELKYRELYENGPDLYATIDPATESLLDCNRTLCEALGYDKHELVGRPYHVVYDQDYLTDRQPAARVAFDETGGFVDVERRLKRKDGSALDVSLSLRSIRDAAGKVALAQAVWRDISRRKQAEKDSAFLLALGDALRASTAVTDVVRAVCARLGQYLDVSRCSFVEIDRAGDRALFHPGYEVGVEPLVGTVPLSPFGARILEESATAITVVVNDTAADPRTAAAHDVAYAAPSIRAFVAAPQQHEGEWAASVVVMAASPRRWEEREVTLVRLVGERVWMWIEHLRVLAQLRDRDVAEAVHETEQRFRTLVDGVKDYAIFMLDPSGNVRTWNAGAERLKGYAEAEIVGMPYEGFFRDADVARGHPRHILAEAQRLGRFEEEGWRVRKDGSEFMASVILTALHGRDGTLAGFAKVTRDVTNRMKRDEELAAKQTALLASLREREVLLQEVHHRVKNNLQVISSLINMQSRKLEAGAARDALEECKSRVLTIALIHEKLYQAKDYSRIRFAEYARGLAENVFQATGTSPGAVSLDLEIANVALGVDKAIPCGLILNELITNALKHGFPSGRRGRVRVALEPLDGGRLRLTVADDGEGLPETFDLGRARSMGMQLVTTLADQLGAEVSVASSNGASFVLTFAGEDE